MDSLSKVGSTVEKGVRNVLSNAYVMAALKVSLILYASRIAPSLPVGSNALFENTFFKIFAIALIAYFASLDFQLSIILAIVYVLGINVISSRNLLESFTDNRPGKFEMDLSKVTDLLGSPALINKQSLIEPKLNVYPGCVNVTANDLLELFAGDKMKLQDTVAYAMRDLMEKLPEDSPAKENLLKMARVVGTPYNVDALNDENSPLIATMLLNFGYIVTDTCKAPGA
jgi:hypothetical protein